MRYKTAIYKRNLIQFELTSQNTFTTLNQQNTFTLSEFFPQMIQIYTHFCTLLDKSGGTFCNLLFVFYDTVKICAHFGIYNEKKTLIQQNGKDRVYSIFDSVDYYKSFWLLRCIVLKRNNWRKNYVDRTGIWKDCVLVTRSWRTFKFLRNGVDSK